MGQNVGLHMGQLIENKNFRRKSLYRSLHGSFTDK